MRAMRRVENAVPGLRGGGLDGTLLEPSTALRSSAVAPGGRPRRGRSSQEESPLTAGR